MAKYRLVQGNNDIDFTKIPEFNNLKQSELKDLIKFTGCFKNEEELRGYLKHYDLIDYSDKLSIKYKYNKEDKTLKYGITYKDQVPFIDYTNIINFLCQNSNNEKLLDCIYRVYYNEKTNNYANLIVIREYLNVLRRKQFALDDRDQITREYYQALTDFAKKECFRYNRKTRNYDLNFRGMRDLGMLLALQTNVNHLNLNNLTGTNEITNYISSKNIEVYTEPCIEIAKVKTKKQVKGQMTFKINQNGELIY